MGNKLVLECQNHKKQTIISKIEDFDNCPEGGCQEPCKKRMKCGHVCEKLCHVYDCNSINCIKPCTKKYFPCDHLCKKLCYEECGECEEKVEKTLPCGHVKKDCKCSDKNIKCYEKCEEKLKCGHFCKLKCYQDCDSVPCKEEIEKVLPCGHKILAECGKKLYEIVCQQKCEAILECGHKCSGTCGKCLQGSLHIKCELKCGRILPCGHSCQQKCSSECICEKKCENVCPHGYCDDQCCDICVACEEKCVIGCRHRKCYQKCGEICKRLPCNEKCEKKMKCGHQCYGLCGERCPEVCRICNPELECFTKDCFYQCELDEDALIYKTDCGHIFSVDGMDNYFKCNNGKIQMFLCPKCRKILIWEPRYQKYIKEKFIDVQKVKKTHLERNYEKDGISFFSKSKKIVDRILHQFGEVKDKEGTYKPSIFKKQKINIFEIFSKNGNILSCSIEYDNNQLDKKLSIIYNLCKNEFKNKKNYNIKKNTTYNLLTLAEKFMGIEYYAYLLKNQDEKKREKESVFLKNYNIIKSYFIFDGKLTHLFFKDFKKKINNMLYYSILKLKKRNYYFLIDNSEEEYINKEKKIIKDIQESNFSNNNINLKDLDLNSEIEYKEIELIRKFGATWYKCPNGHFYTVGECGRPMEESICPECQSKIGGLNHIPSNQNREVDFESREMNNIRNNNDNLMRDILLEQDENAYENMNINQEHEMDSEVEEAIRNNPEMNDYN